MQSEDGAGRVVPFGKYLLDAMLAEGGMARVYRARLRGALGFEKPLVVKQVRPELARDPRFVAMFVEEAKTLVRLSHPHIVPVYELGVVDGTYFLAMELVEGPTLANLLREGPLPATWVARLGEQIAEALHHAHDRFGLVHRDVTPRNVLVDVEGHARLVDFGIATPAEGLSGEVFGSPGYMSPEQLRGEPLDARSDLFSLGAVLHQALTGRATFLPVDLRDAKGASEAARRATLAGEVPTLPEDVAAPLRECVMACLAPRREDRPATAALVARALRTWLASAAPGGVGAELADRARAATAKPTTDDVGPVTVTSRKGEVRSLATASVLTEALGREVGATAPVTGRVRDSAPSVEGTAPIPGRRSRDPEALEAENAERGLTSPADAVDSSPGSTDTAVAATTSSVSAEAPTGAARTSRWLGGAVLVTLALVVGAWSLRRDETLEPVVEPTSVVEPVRAQPEPEPVPIEPPSMRVAPVETAPEVVEPDPVPSRGQITVHATPWAEVSLDGRPLGTTPIRRTTLSAGAHVLVFENPPLGRSLRVPVRVEPGQSLRILADLTTDDPRARIR
ncbi:MAG: protein kinase [Myxococcales bacterium]|nr:protein kinase [Myxococcales bacterium]